MNPYEAPNAPTEPTHDAFDPDKPSRASITWTIIGVAIAAVFVRAILEMVGLVKVSAYSALGLGVLVAAVAERGPKYYLDQRWSMIAVVVTSGAVVASLALSFALGNGIVAPGVSVAAIVIAGFRTARAERRAQERDSLDLRDREQRAHFVEMERRERELPVRKPSPVATSLRLACESCGELTLDSELTTVEGQRICATCAGG